MFLMHRRKHQTRKEQTFNERDQNAIFKWTNWFFSDNIIDIHLIFRELDRPTRTDAFSLSYLCFFLAKQFFALHSNGHFHFESLSLRNLSDDGPFHKRTIFQNYSTITMSILYAITLHISLRRNDRWRKILIHIFIFNRKTQKSIQSKVVVPTEINGKE